ncbi:hypothetical protein GH733_006410, partial [Mirounga leonina]
MGIKHKKGKTLLAKAVANQTSATFLRVAGSELIEKYLGNKPKPFRNCFQLGKNMHDPLCLLMKLMPLEQKDITYMSVTKKHIFQIHTSRKTLADDVTLDDLSKAKNDLS